MEMHSPSIPSLLSDIFMPGAVGGVNGPLLSAFGVIALIVPLIDCLSIWGQHLHNDWQEVRTPSGQHFFFFIHS
jgi:hypothetical protein